MNGKSKILSGCLLAALTAVAPAIAQTQDPAAASPFGVTFDKDPTRSDSEVRYNHRSESVNGIIGTGMGAVGSIIGDSNPQGSIAPPEQEIKYIDGIPVVSQRNSVSGIEWEDMNRFSRQGSHEYPEDKLRNELKKPMPEFRPFGNRMKEISDQLKSTTPE